MAAPRVLIEVSPRIIGGTETFLCNLASHLDRKRIVPVLLFAGEGPAWEAARRSKLECHRLSYLDPQFPLGKLGHFLRAKRISLVQSGYFSLPLAMATRVAELPHLWRIGGYIEVVFPAMAERRRQHLLAMMGELSEKIICPTRFLANQFLEQGIRKVSVIANGVLLPKHRPRSQATPSTIVSFAHFLPQKRHEDLLKALALLRKKYPALRAELFGSHYTEGPHRNHGALIRRLVHRLGLTENVWMGKGGSERFDALAQAYAFVLASEEEGSSNAIVEAMARGVPVIATRSGGNPEIVKHGATGLLVPPRKPARLAAALDKLLQDPALARRMGEKGRQRVSRELTIERAARAYQALYLEALRRGTR